MKKKISKNIIALAVLVLVFCPVFALTVSAGYNSADNLLWNNTENDVAAEIGLGNSTAQVMIAKLINAALGFLGIVAVLIILLGGFKWMTGGGNEDKVGEAKKLIGAGIIGLIIVMASWALARFVIDAVYSATE